MAVRPRRRSRFKTALVVGIVVGAGVGLYVSPLGVRVRQALGGGTPPEEPPESIPIPSASMAGTATPATEPAAAPQAASDGGDGVLAGQPAEAES